MVTRVALAAAVVVLAATTAGGCGGPADKFTRDCTAKGGHVVVTNRQGSMSKVCLPPP